MESLLLTLGHNSSSILVRDGHVVCGYEEERLSLRKSDSRFPINSISKCLEYSEEDIESIFVSHWFPYGELPSNPNKYWNPFSITELVGSNPTVYSVNEDFTHHDCHARSAIVFCDSKMPSEDTGIIVADGFGNFGECLSVYDVSPLYSAVLRKRAFGYSKSLGLMYQYATAYLGMIENQDEYKLLGYEPRMFSLDLGLARNIESDAMSDGDAHYNDLFSHIIGNRYDPMYAIDALPAIKLLYANMFDRLLKSWSLKHASSYIKKCAISLYTQTRLERVMINLIESLEYKNLILVGGVFMNVKLNFAISKIVEKLSIMPLAGDQGAAMGLYDIMELNLVWPDHLFWGHRNLDVKEMSLPKNMITCYSEKAIDKIIDLLNRDCVVNLVRGSMEYGARALCHTSTLAIPTQNNVDYINSVNSRSSIMPMAPVLTQEAFNKTFAPNSEIIKSLDYMICAVEYRDYCPGVTHYYPEYDIWTGRPQIARESFMISILEQIPKETLINTSFNEHGMPIVYSIQDAKRCHLYQTNFGSSNRIVTVVITDE